MKDDEDEPTHEDMVERALAMKDAFANLVKAGLIVDSGRRRPGRDGWPQIVWVVNPELSEEEQEQRMAALRAERKRRSP
jgi:hypothetical protein